MNQDITLSMPSISRNKSSVLANCKSAKATRKTTSIPSIKNMSIILEATARGSVVVKIVRNQEDAYIEVWNPWEIKWA
jgi:hypothetical protein